MLLDAASAAHLQGGIVAGEAEITAPLVVRWRPVT